MKYLIKMLNQTLASIEVQIYNKKDLRFLKCDCDSLIYYRSLVFDICSFFNLIAFIHPIVVVTYP